MMCWPFDPLRPFGPPSFAAAPVGAKQASLASGALSGEAGAYTF